jgi:hypothetical protein
VKLWLAKTGDHLVATDDASREVIAKMGAGECAIFEIVRPRSVQWNRMYWGICRVIGENQDPPRDEDSIDNELRVLSGHYDVMHVDGHEVRVPKRIAFYKLSADEWAEYWMKAEQAIAERWGEEYLQGVAA